MAQNSYLLALVGAGIARSLSPELHEREAQRHGVRCLYRLLDVELPQDAPGEHLQDLVRSASLLGFAGLNITHPYKRLVMPHIYELAPSALRVGAVNTLVFRPDGTTVGHNTDLAGFAAAFARGLPGVRLGQVVQLGAGGAGAAVAHAFLDLGVQRLSIADPCADRAHDLAKDLNEAAGANWAEGCTAGEAEARTQEADGLVNASPIGTEHHPRLPLDPKALHAGLWVADVNYHPLRTPLLHAASALGCAVLHGGGMLVHQAAASFRLFTGLEPKASHMLADFADLTADRLAHS
ncbi:shikimate dehydrogenase [Streptomyces sp. NBC_01445]|uniref:shikimate dehydrogenase n=1 Tax=Streptomyces sp. NBC_01445 TaxID=2903869 RepID=UPI002DDA923C|nr:shikimate dehydrogenase [Streptomyces sp. NBC_01445]WSE09235.1 shikimate dehydrogenase [Streptomyces sp. NBC_01445]